MVLGSSSDLKSEFNINHKNLKRSKLSKIKGLKQFNFISSNANSIFFKLISRCKTHKDKFFAIAKSLQDLPI